MRTDIRTSLGKVFLVWMLLGSALWLIGPGELQELFGDGLLWALLMPLSCLAVVQPRRSLGVLLGLAAVVTWPLWQFLQRSSGEKLARSRPQATPW